MTHPNRRKGDDLEERFWAKVQKGPGCWEWRGSLNSAGYGQISRSHRKLVLAHRLSFEMEHGPIPIGMWVLHRCDNPPCVRPCHLFLGTPLDNIHDSIRKGRFTRAIGVDNGHAKLTFEQVQEIRRRFAWLGPHKTNSQVLAAEYGVTPTYVCELARGKWRKHA